MKLKKHLQRLLLLAGILLLAFYGAARLHEVILSRSAMKSFEATREAKLNEGGKENSAAQPDPKVNGHDIATFLVSGGLGNQLGKLSRRHSIALCHAPITRKNAT